MATLVSNCPHSSCRSKDQTFDIKAVKEISAEYFQDIASGTRHKTSSLCELYSICKRCQKGTIFIAKFGKGICDQIYNIAASKKSLAEEVNLDLTTHIKELRYVSLKDMVAQKAPEHVPPEIEKAFNEAAICFAVQCYNASGAMSRLCLDLTTKQSMLFSNGQLEKGKRDDIYNRLSYLFEHKIFPSRLETLSHCIKNDGNDAVHDGVIGKDEAEDMLEFATLLLEEIYTSKHRADNAAQRRKERKSQSS